MPRDSSKQLQRRLNGTWLLLWLLTDQRRAWLIQKCELKVSVMCNANLSRAPCTIVLFSHFRGPCSGMVAGACFSGGVSNCTVHFDRSKFSPRLRLASELKMPRMLPSTLCRPISFPWYKCNVWRICSSLLESLSSFKASYIDSEKRKEAIWSPCWSPGELWRI